MPFFIITRLDSNADGAGRNEEITMGMVHSGDHKRATAFAHEHCVRNECQWVELENTKTAKRGKYSAALRIGVYLACPDCGIVLVKPTAFAGERVPCVGECPTCEMTLMFGE